MNFRNTLLAAGVALTTCGAAALSLGESRGTVVLGRPLDLVFQVLTDGTESVDGACVAADVLLGDTLISQARIDITPLPAMPGRSSAVRLRASGVVNEPIVTVQLSAGCSGKITRTYTFLADLPDTVAAATAPIAIAALKPDAAPARSDGRGTQAPPSPGSGRSARPPAPGAESPEASVPRPAPRPAPREHAAPVPRVAASAAPAVPSQRARLVIEPLDLSPPALAGLRLSTELAQIPGEAATEQRAEAAAAWRILGSTPEELRRSSASLEQLTADLNTLRASTAQDQATMAGLRDRLEMVESERFPATLVYALLALLAAALAGLAWLWQRARTAQNTAWHDAVERHHDADSTARPTDTPVAAPVPVALAPLEAVQAAPADAPVPDEPGNQAAAPAAPVPAVPMAADPVEPAVPAVRVINPEALFDLQQQAEFFVSVGEHDQAIDVMKQHIADNEQSSPLAYLDLMRLYHSLGRIDDFNALRAQFHRYFNAQVPEFAGFNRPGHTLLGYTDALAAIEAQWSDDVVLQQLESCLFRRDNAAMPLFDLAAYEDLLLLYAIAQTTPASVRGAPPPRARTTPEDATLSEGIGVLPTASGRQGHEPGDLLQEHLPEMGLPALDLLPAAAPQAAPSLPDYDFPWALETLSPALDEAAPHAIATQPPPAPPSYAPAPDADGLAQVLLDLDLTAPHEPMEMDFPLPSLTLQDVPAVPVTPAPLPGQPVGFGSSNSRFEVRFELDDDLLLPPDKPGKGA